MNIRRFFKHASTGQWLVRRYFSQASLDAIARAVKDCEQLHPGEIRFVIEAALSPAAAGSGITPRQRAVEVFAQQRVWDTEHNNGVLIYLLLADHAIEIVADRYVARGRVPQAEWDAACRELQKHFKLGNYEAGAIACVHAVSTILATHPPGPRDVGNEMPDAPLVL
ncbi:MAG: TPM domain-containing protein [Pseudomonadota bacterium]